ncbi:minichromosome maintenance domain-containing protein 2 isoform X2 [Anguilla rostrata]|uniref:minichromosome maintenance domain-containing protein 2 isoform X2 n=1 Tax=Anguilla rostrata TaxID=7938 RepID=UPI0030CFD0AF
MAELLEMKEAIVSYLDRSGGLLQFVDDCKLYNDSAQSEAVYRFCIHVNPTDLIELDARLADCLLHDPFKATALFQSVCFLSIKTLSLIEKIHTENQVNVVLKLTHLPPFPEYFLDLCKFPRGYGPMRPVAMEGLTIAMTRITKYTQGARFLCTDDKCPFSRGFHHIRVHSPGATESVTVRGGFTCALCSAPLKEDVKFRVLGDKQLVEMVPAQALDVLSVHPPCSFRYQSVTLFLRDPSLVSSNFQALLAASACSTWRFSAILANTFGSPVIPPGLYSTLKLVLLLSLVQTSEDDPDSLNYLDVFALTNDTLIIERLMTYSLGLASRGIRHQVTGELFVSLSRDEHGTGAANVHAGSALLASGGVCLLGDLASYRKDKMEALQSALETRTAALFIPGKKYGEDVDQQLSFPIQCNFWALCDITTGAKRSLNSDSAVLGSAEMGPVPAQIAEAFSLLVQCREAGRDRSLLPLVVHTLRLAVRPGEPLYPACMQFTTQDYQELLAHARGLRVELSPEAEKLIHGYYMASRRVRSDSTQGSSLPVASIRHLISLAEAHSKLSLRRVVLEEDAVVAVLLCENSVTLKHGASALVIPPDALFPCDLHDLDSLRRRDLTLEQLHQQILQFVYAYAPGAASYITEE